MSKAHGKGKGEEVGAALRRKGGEHFLSCFVTIPTATSPKSVSRSAAVGRTKKFANKRDRHWPPDAISKPRNRQPTPSSPQFPRLRMALSNQKSKNVRFNAKNSHFSKHRNNSIKESMHMQLFVNIAAGKTAVLQAEPEWTLEQLKLLIEQRTGVQVEDQRLSFDGHQLREADELRTLAELGLCPDATLRLIGGRLCGGGAYDRTDPKLVQLAKSYRWDQLICRKCYARLDSRAANCRKCGSADLRKRSLMLSKPL